MAHIVELKNATGVAEKSMWIKRGAEKEAGTGLERTIEELCVAPASFLPLLIREEHGQDHANRTETIRKVCQEW